MSEEIIDQAAEDFKQALKKQFTPQDFSFKPRPSNLGKPLCQLQLAKAGARAEDKPYTFKMIVTFGDAIEAILKAILKSQCTLLFSQLFSVPEWPDLLKCKHN